jgi:hypothetical protein
MLKINHQIPFEHPINCHSCASILRVDQSQQLLATTTSLLIVRGTDGAA